MKIRSFRSSLASALLLAAVLAVPALTLAGEARVGGASLRSTPFANSAYGPGLVSGRATLTTNAGTDTTSVMVRVEGLAPGTTHIGHIHFGDATDPCARLQPARSSRISDRSRPTRTASPWPAR